MIRTASALTAYLVVAAALLLSLLSLGSTSSASASASATHPMMVSAGITAQGGNVGTMLPMSGTTGGGGNR